MLAGMPVLFLLEQSTASHITLEIWIMEIKDDAKVLFSSITDIIPISYLSSTKKLAKII